MGHDPSEPSFAHFDDYLINMTLVDPFFDVRQTANVQWRVRQNAVHPREAVHGEKTVQYAHHKQV